MQFSSYKIQLINNQCLQRHTIPQINGSCGVSSVERILNAIGYSYSCIDYDSGVYVVETQQKQVA